MCFDIDRNSAPFNGNKKRNAFADLKREAQSANKNVKKIKMMLKPAGKHGKKNKREYYRSSGSSSSGSDSK